jgi:hypothetical protein
MSKHLAVFPRRSARPLHIVNTYSAAINQTSALNMLRWVRRSDGSPVRVRGAGSPGILRFRYLVATLKAGGCGLNDIVDVTTFIRITEPVWHDHVGRGVLRRRIELDGGRRQLARGIRLRDQGHCRIQLNAEQPVFGQSTQTGDKLKVSSGRRFKFIAALRTFGNLCSPQ